MLLTHNRTPPMLIRTEGRFFGDEPWRLFCNIYHLYYVSCRPMSQSSSCASRQKPPSVCTHSAGASTPQRPEGWSRLAARSASRLSPMTWALRARRLRRVAASRSRSRSAPALRALGAPQALRARAPGGAAAGCHRRVALRAPPMRLRQPGCHLALRARRRRRRRCAPGRLHVHPSAITCARCLLLVGMSKMSCALRCSRRSAQGALGAPAEGEGWGGVVQTSSCASVGGTLACCRSMCSASQRGASLETE